MVAGTDATLLKAAHLTICAVLSLHVFTQSSVFI